MTATTSTTSTTRPGRTANITLWVVQVLLAIVYVGVSVPKVTLDPTAVEGFDAMVGFSATGTLVIGLLEIAGAIGLLVPKLNGIAALGLVGLMIGAVGVTTAAMGASMALLPAVLLVLAAVIAWFRRYRTVELIAMLRGRATR